LGIFTEKSPNLRPEFSQAYDVGWDHRMPNGGVLGLDLQNTTVHDVFQQLTLAENTTFNGQTGVLGIFTPINVATLRAQLIIVKYNFEPVKGLGYGASLAADRSILSGIPNSAYNANAGFPVNNVQICGTGLVTPGLATCIPYLKGYGHIDYIGAGGLYTSLGVDYEGKNNAYYQPPFFQFDLTARKAITKNIDFQLSIQNLLNTNDPTFIPAPNAGFPVTAETSTGLTSYTGASLIPTVPRTLRGEFKLHM
jgi:outer membrane receptor protein involved in Fe transport